MRVVKRPAFCQGDEQTFLICAAQKDCSMDVQSRQVWDCLMQIDKGAFQRGRGARAQWGVFYRTYTACPNMN